jgi:hypothetical protein
VETFTGRAFQGALEANEPMATVGLRDLQHANVGQVKWDANRVVHMGSEVEIEPQSSHSYQTARITKYSGHPREFRESPTYLSIADEC